MGTDKGDSRARRPVRSDTAENSAYQANLYGTAQPSAAHLSERANPTAPHTPPPQPVLDALPQHGQHAGNPVARQRYGELLTPDTTPGRQRDAAAAPQQAAGGPQRRYGVPLQSERTLGVAWAPDNSDIMIDGDASDQISEDASGGMTARTGALSTLAHYTSLLVAEHPLQAHRCAADNSLVSFGNSRRDSFPSLGSRKAVTATCSMNEGKLDI